MIVTMDSVVITGTMAASTVRAKLGLGNHRLQLSVNIGLGNHRLFHSVKMRFGNGVVIQERCVNFSKLKPQRTSYPADSPQHKPHSYF